MSTQAAARSHQICSQATSQLASSVQFDVDSGARTTAAHRWHRVCLASDSERASVDAYVHQHDVGTACALRATASELASSTHQHDAAGSPEV